MLAFYSVFEELFLFSGGTCCSGLEFGKLPKVVLGFPEYNQYQNIIMYVHVHDVF